VNGINALVAIVTEPVGPNCAYGGSKVASGLDANRDNALQLGEVTSTTYLCNPPPAGLAWVDVASTATQAQPNTGYIAHSSSNVVVTLPLTPAIGDITRVSGLGSGGWTIAQNPGQLILVGVTPFIARDAVRAWRGLAVSSDGMKVIAALYNGTLMRSVDAGTTWLPVGPTGSWISAASSADGQRLMAGREGGDVWVSNDGGQTWTPRGLSGDWYALASSADGSKLVAASYATGYIYTSADFGSTWTARENPRRWTALASSSDGSKLIASAQGSGGERLYVSTDSGQSWTPYGVLGNWRGVASSADGTRLAATDFGGRLWTSPDSGLTWTAHEATQNWHYIASSSDGRRLVASAHGERVYRSSDSGMTWQPISSPALWWGVAISADGRSLIAGADGARVYNQGLLASSTTGTAGSISGEFLEWIDLLYTGGGVFTTLGSSPNLVVQ